MTRGPVPFIMTELGLEPINFLTNQATFRGLLVVTGI